VTDPEAEQFQRWVQVWADRAALAAEMVARAVWKRNPDINLRERSVSEYVTNIAHHLIAFQLGITGKEFEAKINAKYNTDQFGPLMNRMLDEFAAPLLRDMHVKGAPPERPQHLDLPPGLTLAEFLQRQADAAERPVPPVQGTAPDGTVVSAVFLPHAFTENTDPLFKGTCSICGCALAATWHSGFSTTGGGTSSTSAP
jgi:hypothetical protein